MCVVEGNNEDDEGEAVLPVLYVSEPAVMKLWLKKARKKSRKKVAKKSREKKSRKIREKKSREKSREKSHEKKSRKNMS